jgi:hypothetical protein
MCLVCTIVELRVGYKKMNSLTVGTIIIIIIIIITISKIILLREIMKYEIVPVDAMKVYAGVEVQLH